VSIDTVQFRAALLEERERVENAIANLRDDHPGRMDEEVEEMSGMSDNHLGETATATLDREIDYSLEENSTQVLLEIDAALARIDAGSYGTCTRCGAEIPQGRLDAKPWASLCIECKRETEKP